MARQAFVPPALRNRKKQPLLPDKPHPKPELATAGAGAEMNGGGAVRGRKLERTNAIQTKRAGEVAGGAAAECAAVCCCCPCTLMNIVVMAVYKVPAGLCRKAKKRRQRLRRKKQQNQHGLLAPTTTSSSGGSREELEREVREVVERGREGAAADGGAKATEAEDLEKEMWNRFHGTGFWRSPSQRE